MVQICKICSTYMQYHVELINWFKCGSCGYSCDIFGKNIMISRDEVLMRRDEEFPLTPELENNLSNLLIAVNKLRTLYGKSMYVSSGYRPGHYNKDAGGATNSTHISCQAVDFHDNDNALKNWITVEILEQCGLYQEDPASTPVWIHVDIRPRSHRIFKP